MQSAQNLEEVYIHLHLLPGACPTAQTGAPSPKALPQDPLVSHPWCTFSLRRSGHTRRYKHCTLRKNIPQHPQSSSTHLHRSNQQTSFREAVERKRKQAQRNTCNRDKATNGRNASLPSGPVTERRGEMGGLHTCTHESKRTTYTHRHINIHMITKHMTTQTHDAT